MPTAFSQRDPRWSDIPLGNYGGQTIGEAGCLITSVASALCDLTGDPWTPGLLDAWLCDHNGYQSGNLYSWYAVGALGLTVAHLIECLLVPAPIDQIETALAAGQAVIAEVDWSPGGEVDQHWVRVLEVLDGGRDLLLTDPWGLPGEEICRLSERYLAPGWDTARAILYMAIYKATSGA